MDKKTVHERLDSLESKLDALISYTLSKDGVDDVKIEETKSALENIIK